MVKHKASVTNRVADALSRHKSLLTQMSIEVPSFESFTELFKTDPYFGKGSNGRKNRFYVA